MELPAKLLTTKFPLLLTVVLWHATLQYSLCTVLTRAAVVLIRGVMVMFRQKFTLTGAFMFLKSRKYKTD